MLKITKNQTTKVLGARMSGRRAKTKKEKEKKRINYFLIAFREIKRRMFWP